MAQYKAIEIVSRPLKKTRYRLNKGLTMSSPDEKIKENISHATVLPTEPIDAELLEDTASPSSIDPKELERLKKAADRVAKREARKEEKLLKKNGPPNTDPEEEYVKRLKEKAKALDKAKEKKKNRPRFSIYEEVSETEAEKRRRITEEEINFDGYYSVVPPLDEGLEVKRTKRRANKEVLKFAAAIFILLLIAIVCLIKVLI